MVLIFIWRASAPYSYMLLHQLYCMYLLYCIYCILTWYELKQDDQLTVCQLFVNLQRTGHSPRDLQDERNVLYACIIMPPMATDNETDESIRLLASVSIATSGQTNQFLQYKQWFGNVKKRVTTQPSAPRMQSNSERMAGCVVGVNHNH